MMINFKLFTVIAVTLLTFGKITAQNSTTVVEKSTITTTQKVNLSKHQLSGKATYYGTHYNNKRKTASGEKFKKNALTAAHKTLPFGTKVKVTNTKNGKSVIVRINDRGPYSKNKVIDLSPAAFAQISSLKAGVANIKIEIL